MNWPFNDLPMFGFDFIMIDPPWHFETWSAKGESKSGAAQYATMTLGDICRLPVGHLGARNCVYWLWATHPMHREAFDVLEAWGVRYVTGGTWVKRTVNGKLAFGTGYRLRCASEPFLLATNGSPDTARDVRTVIEGRIREHSRKPEEAYHEAERLMRRTSSARMLDLFSRQTRPGWKNWGLEATKFDGRAA